MGENLSLNDKVIKVVLPTDINFFIDPYEIMEEGTMIISSDFNIINKSSVPIRMDMSFEIFTEDDISLNFKNERHAVNSNSGERDIWFAAVFSRDIEHTVKTKREIALGKGIHILESDENLIVSGAALR